MTEQHLITPPPELFKQWRDEALNSFPDDENPCPCDIDDARDEHIATQAARWGADQELEACCEYIGGKGKWFANPEYRLAELRAARRPKPPSLAEEALEALEEEDDAWPVRSLEKGKRFALIRRALERLQELENNG